MTDLPFPYQWLLFDADGTLFDYEAAEYNAISNLVTELGRPFETPLLQAYQQINSQLWLARERGEIGVEALKTERFARFLDHIKLSADPHATSARYLELLGQEATLIDGAPALLAQLRPHFKMALVTNGLKEVQYARLSRSPIQRYFDAVIISDEIGPSKPDPRFFKITFERVGNPAKNAAIIIGDSLTSDIQGGNNYGIATCWFNPHHHDRPPGYDITYEINTLAELIGILIPDTLLPETGF